MLHEIISNVVNGVLEIEFFSEKANALSVGLVHEFRGIILGIEKDPRVKVVVIRSRGEKVFSAGANLQDYKALKTEIKIAEYLFSIGELLAEIMYSKVPVLSIVQGKAVGGAIGLVAASDYVIAEEGATFRLSELTLGIAPLVISPFLELKLGTSGLYNMAFSAKWFDAIWARDRGLVSEVASSSDLNSAIKAFTDLYSGSLVTPVGVFKAGVLPEKKSFIAKLRNYSDLNAPYVVQAINSNIF